MPSFVITCLMITLSGMMYDMLRYDIW